MRCRLCGYMWRDKWDAGSVIGICDIWCVGICWGINEMQAV